VESIDVVDDLTVKFKLSYAVPLDVVASSQYGAYIMSIAAAAQPSEWFNQGNEGGTGPYILESFSPGERAVLVRFDDYWGGWREGQFDQVISCWQWPILSRGCRWSSRAMADATCSIPEDSLEGLKADPNVIVVSSFALPELALEGQHQTIHPWDDVRVRQALAWSLPYDDCIKAGGDALAAERSANSYGDVRQTLVPSAPTRPT